MAAKTKVVLENEIKGLKAEKKQFIKQMNSMMEQGKIKNDRIEELEKQLLEQTELYSTLLYESKLKGGK